MDTVLPNFFGQFEGTLPKRPPASIRSPPVAKPFSVAGRFNREGRLRVPGGRQRPGPGSAGPGHPHGARREAGVEPELGAVDSVTQRTAEYRTVKISEGFWGSKSDDGIGGFPFTH